MNRLRLGCLWAVFAAMLASMSLTYGQVPDTLTLSSVTVHGLPVSKYLAGATLHSLDSQAITLHQGRHLGEVLSAYLPVYFRSYGHGMISSISLRGTSPQQTAVVWNGIPIQSFSLGMADFSLLPTAAFDRIDVMTGGGSSLFGSGAIGGAILLDSKPRAPGAIFSQSVESFGRYQSAATLAGTLGKWQWHTKAYGLKAENNFPVLGTDFRQHNAALTQYGLVQQIHRPISPRSTLQIDYWYHHANREVQPVVGDLVSADTQRDASHRWLATWHRQTPAVNLTAKGGYIRDLLAFNNAPGTLFRWTGQVVQEIPLNQWSLRGSADWNHITGKIPEYGPNPPKEHRGDLGLALRRDLAQGGEVALHLRKPFVSGFSAPWLPYLGMAWQVWTLPQSRWVVRANASRNFRAPTLNDRYWPEVGRTDLKAETTLAWEGAMKWQRKSLSVEAIRFWQLVDNWIQWTPLNNRWIPQNLRQVEASGWEARQSWQFHMGTLMFRQSLGYQYTRSIITQAPTYEAQLIGKQLIYTPLHTGYARASGSWGSWEGHLHWIYAGKRYTNTDNSELFALGGFLLGEAGLSKFWRKPKTVWQVQLTVRNLTHQNYRLYAGNAMPGRHYSLNLTYHFTNSKQK